MCEEVTVSPCGMLTIIGLVAIFWLMSGVVIKIYCPVLSESALRGGGF